LAVESIAGRLKERGGLKTIRRVPIRENRRKKKKKTRSRRIRKAFLWDFVETEPHFCRFRRFRSPSGTESEDLVSTIMHGKRRFGAAVPEERSGHA
jgi:hypothetical protein